MKSAQQMVVTAQDLRAAGIDVPIMVGGAALSRKFTKTRIAPEYGGLVLYAKDAMDGLNLANQLSNPDQKARLIQELKETKEAQLKEADLSEEKAMPTLTRVKTSTISRDVPVQIPPDQERHILRDYPISYLMPYVNMQMLLGHHLGLKGKVEKLLVERDPKALQLKDTVDSILSEAQRHHIIRANGMYCFFPAQSAGNDVIIYDPENGKQEIKRFTFPRQHKEPYYCLADYLKPVDSGQMDYVGFLVVTAGHGISELSRDWREKGDYLKSHALQATALELAEAFAERIHQMMRDLWGIPDPATMTMQERFGAKYTGQRFSFGYPACPALEDQRLLFELMKTEDIGVELTEGCMMEPEASVSAIVFAHPEARYFNVL